jgi:hypothetical protein
MLIPIIFEARLPVFAFTIHPKNVVVLSISSLSASVAALPGILLTCQTKTTDKILKKHKKQHYETVIRHRLICTLNGNKRIC